MINFMRGTALAAVMLLCGCDPEIRAIVLYEGDSLMSTSTRAIHNLNMHQDRAVLSVNDSSGGNAMVYDDGYNLQRLANIQDVIKIDIMFISIGGNDIHTETGMDNLDAKVAARLDAVAGIPKVYWVLPHNSVRNKWSADNFDTVTEAITNAYQSGQWPNLQLLSFDSWAKENNLDIVLLIAPDGAHLTTAGQRAWARMLDANTRETI